MAVGIAPVLIKPYCAGELLVAVGIAPGSIVSNGPVFSNGIGELLVAEVIAVVSIIPNGICELLVAAVVAAVPNTPYCVGELLLAVDSSPLTRIPN